MRFYPLIITPLISRALSQDPGLPVQNPSISYWQIPPNDDVADHQSEKLPEKADVVIIGSGMSGTSIAWHLLHGNNGSQSLKVAMLEARQSCSGATGRNGGHIRPSSYSEYAAVKNVTSSEDAVKITELRAAHVNALISAAASLPEEGREAAQARAVDSIDAFYDEASWEEAVQQWNVLVKEIPDIGNEWIKFEKDEARKMSLLPDTVGVLAGTPKIAGAIWPYRFVTHAQKLLLDTYEGFSLDTNTTATAVNAVQDDSVPYNFEVVTPRGTILAHHVVHAANAWTPHLVPGLRGSITGGRLHMSAQLGGAGLPKSGEWPVYTGNVSQSGGRAWSLFREGLDYVVQMPGNDEYMFGGGGGIQESGANPMDDSGLPDHTVASYLNGALPNYFGYDNWGSERTDFPQDLGEDLWPGRSKRVWIGIEGMSNDEMPFVGQLSESLTNRTVKNVSAGAEWTSAAFNGEGMCFAWLCGEAISEMILNYGSNKNVSDWFPQSFLVTPGRLVGQNTTVSRRKRLRI